MDRAILEAVQLSLLSNLAKLEFTNLLLLIINIEIVRDLLDDLLSN